VDQYWGQAKMEVNRSLKMFIFSIDFLSS